MSSCLSSTIYRLGILVTLTVLSSCSQQPEPSTDNLSTLDLGALDYDEQLLEVTKLAPEFAGFYYDDSGKLVVGIQNAAETSSRSARTSAKQLTTTMDAIAEVFGEDMLTAGRASLGFDVSPEKAVSQPLTYDATYSFKELYGWYGTVTGLLDGIEVSFTDIDEVKNRIVIGLVPETSQVGQTQLTEKLGKTTVPLEAVKFVEEARVTTEANLTDRLRPLRGGSFLDFSPGTLCTLGMVVKIAGANGVLTNSHYSEKIWRKDSTKYYQNRSSVANSFIGVETLDPPSFTKTSFDWCPGGRVCRHSDSSFIRLSVTPGVGNIWKTTGIESGSLTIRTTRDPRDEYIDFFKMSGKDNRNFPGTVMHKVGSTTGCTSGKILGTCVEAYVASDSKADGRLRYIKCNTKYAANSRGGDSGSPVFERFIVNDSFSNSNIHSHDID